MQGRTVSVPAVCNDDELTAEMIQNEDPSLPQQSHLGEQHRLLHALPPLRGLKAHNPGLLLPQPTSTAPLLLLHGVHRPRLVLNNRRELQEVPGEDQLDACQARSS